MTITRKSGEEEDVIYPESDGKPMADNTRQFRYIALLKAGFDAMYIDRDDVFINVHRVKSGFEQRNIAELSRVVCHWLAVGFWINDIFFLPGFPRYCHGSRLP